MPSIPQIQISQQYARIGIDADLGRYEMKQPRPTFELEQPQATMEMRQPLGELEIDQSKAWDALGRANILVVMNRIYSQARDIALQGIAKIVEDGNRMAAINKTSADAIPELASDVTVSFPDFQYAGEAAFDNVDIQYTARKPEVRITPGQIKLNTHPNPPEVEYFRGKLDIYMQQYNKVEITPPAIDIRA
ncbi:DUF6470 family protein [Paenibacillus flagellatus]|uniref:Uncharacterized protein n=1 Tax=Paenibacillus flagellatus TaxID=2211139 RepID=A0A2V5JWT0_9BACL|nr:DUF6470 family protein [Paenibacillus flagellatus]PYI51178.1 hypothetical protein DLM86_26175 [Paenibacillus flagellatus]